MSRRLHSNQERVNGLLQSLTTRAERNDSGTLRDTFVNIGGIEQALLNKDNKIIFGRRGTGKTHALLYLHELINTKGDIPIYIDLRKIGSDISIYSDRGSDAPSRACRLLRDFVLGLHDEIISYFSNRNLEILAECGEELEALASAVMSIEIYGDVQAETEQIKSRQSDASGNVSVDTKSLKIGLAGKYGEEDKRSDKLQINGKMELNIRFGRLTTALNDLLNRLHRRLWILMDEWSAIPKDIQPYLADMLRRAFFPVSSITVQIAAIEHRAAFYIGSSQHYIGIEMGADAAANINLDDFMVFENDPQRSRDFFCELIFRHCAALDEKKMIKSTSAKSFSSEIFTNSTTVNEFVKACEGVPRDAIYILAKAARKSAKHKISVPNIRAAARDWFQQDKSNFLRDNQEADFFLRWVIDKVIGERKARAFLIDSRIPSSTIDELYDHRLLHIAKKSVSAHDRPGVRFLIYKLDYGCYVDLMTTQRAPQGLLPAADKEGAYIEVPPDDYRAIRRAVLDLTEFNLEKLKDALKAKGLPTGPVALAFDWDISFARLLGTLYHKSKRPSGSEQLDLFYTKMEKD